MKTALTVLTTAILTGIAFLFAWQQWLLGDYSFIVDSQYLWDANENTACDSLAEQGSACITPRDETVPHGEWVLSFDDSGIQEGDEGCTSVTSICNNGSWRNDVAPLAYNTCSVDATANTWLNLDEQPCLVGDVLVPHDSTYTYYKKSGVGTSATYQAQKRFCFNGILEGDESYDILNLVSSCVLDIEEEKEEEPVAVPTPKPSRAEALPVKPAEPVYARCTGPFGGVWEHGKSGTAYTSSFVPHGGSCEQVSIVCGFGSIRYGTANNIGQPVGKQLYSSCSVGDPVGCSSPCGEVGHGDSVTSYESSVVPFGQWTCNEKQIVSTCSNGTLYPSAWSTCSCEVADPIACNTPCGQVAHGESITTYGQSILAYGDTKTCADIQTISTCDNGKLSWEVGATCSCSVAQPVGCTAPNGQQIAHGGSLTLYQYSQVQALAWDGSDTCVRQWRKCENGVFYDYGWSPASFTFQHPTCEVLAPPAWWWAWGEWVPTN